MLYINIQNRASSTYTCSSKACVLTLFLLGTVVSADEISDKIIKERLRSQNRLKLRRRLPSYKQHSDSEWSSESYPRQSEENDDDKTTTSTSVTKVLKEVLDIFVPTAMMTQYDVNRHDALYDCDSLSGEELQEAKNAQMEIKHQNRFLGFGALMTVLSGGIVADSFREVMNDISHEGTPDKLSFDMGCALVLVFAFLGSWALRKALFSNVDGGLAVKLGSLSAYGAAVTTTLSMVFLDKMQEGSMEVSTSFIMMYVTVGLVAFALACAVWRRYGKGAKFSTLANGAGATLLVAGASLFMYNMRESLGDVFETYHANTVNGSEADVDFSSIGAQFWIMTGCMAVGLIWLCYITFWKRFNLGNGKGKVTAVIGSACILSAGGLAIAGLGGIGAVTEHAVNNGIEDMTMGNFLSYKSVYEPQTFLFIAGGLFVLGLLIRLGMQKKWCEAREM